MSEVSEIFENKEVNKENKDIFTQEDLKKFTDLVNNEKTFQELIECYDKDIELNKIEGLTTVIETEIKKPENQNQRDIFEKKYTELTPAQQDLYEICILGAILKNNFEKIPNPDYKKLAKQYYESIKTIDEDEFGNEIIKESDIGKLPLEKWTDKKVYDIGSYRFYGNGRTVNESGERADWTNIIEKNTSKNGRQRKKVENKETIDEDEFGNKIIKESDMGKLPLEKWTEKKVYDIGSYRFYGNGRTVNESGERADWTNIIEKNTSKNGRQRKKVENETIDEDEIIDGGEIIMDGNEEIENKEEAEIKNIEGTYNTASSNMKQETITVIENKTVIEEGNKLIEASIKVSAGADLRKMNEETAKADRTAKITKLKTYKSKYTNTENKTTIDSLIQELSTSNIESKITDLGTDNKDNKEQNGNRYLIGARIAEGFIQALDKLTGNPEPILITKIDRENCIIGKSKNNNDVETDRNISINLSLKVESSTIEEEEEETITEDINDTDKNKDNKDNTPNISITKGSDGDNKGEGKGNSKSNQKNIQNTTGNDNTNQGNNPEKVTDNKDKPQETIEPIKNNTEGSPDILVAERIKIAICKDFKRNGKTIDKDKDIQRVRRTKEGNIYTVTIDNKDIKFSCSKIDKDWNFDKDEKGNVKIKEEEKKYYEVKLETTELQEKFKVYDVAENDKNITTTLNEEKTKEAFKKYYTFTDAGYSLDENNITIEKDSIGDVKNIKTNLVFKLPEAIFNNQINKTTTNDTIENVIFDKNGEIKLGSGNTYQKYTGENKLLLITQEKDANDNYKKEDKNLNYNIKTIGNTIRVINDEIHINPTTKLADRKDSKMASEIENANKTQETFKNYTADLDNNFQKRQINALGGNKYQLLVIPKIKGVDEDKYITIPFNYNYNTNTQTKYFSFENSNIHIPEKYKDGDHFVIKNMYYTINIPTGEQISINPKIILDYKKTEEESTKKSNIPNNNQIKEPATEKIDNNKGGRQDRNISLLNKIAYNPANYLDFSLDENNQEIKYSREISLDEVLGYDQTNEKKLVLGTIKFDGKGEIKESEDRNLKINKKNQTLEIKDIFGRNKTLTIPFEIKDKKFTIGTNSNPDAKYITDEFAKQKEYLKNRIYDEKSTITNKVNGKIREMGTQGANEFPGLALDVPTKGLRQSSNTETINAIEYLKGPTSTGLYYLNLNNGYKQENNVRSEEFLYFKVTGTEVKLTDMNGKEIEETYIQSNKEYKPGKGLVKVKNDLTITTINDSEEQEKGYPSFNNEPEAIKTYLTKTVDMAKPTNYEKEVSGQYIRIFGNSKIGHITSLPIKTQENNPNKYLYNKEGIKATTSDDIAKDLRDYDKFGDITRLEGLNEAELKETFIAKYKASEKIDKAIRGDNIRIKNNEGKYEYWNISSNGEGEKIRFEENITSKEIQEKVIDDMKKDLAIIGSIENIKFKYRRDDEKKKILTDWDKAGNRTIKDIEKQTVKDFMKTNTIEDKKIILQLLGPNKETITLDINDNIYQKIESKDLENGYYKNIFESKLGNEADKEIKVQNETYKIHMESNKENQIIFESKVERAQ